jgi:hypothetical protein
MIELGALALILRLVNLGYEPVIATGVVPAGLDTLHAVLADPRSYDGAACVRPSSSARVVAVRVAFGPRRVVRYTWILSPGRGTTEVDLAAQLESRGPAVRLLLLCGGRRLLRRHLESMLATLARDGADAAEQVAPPAAAPVAWPRAA